MLNYNDLQNTNTDVFIKIINYTEKIMIYLHMNGVYWFLEME